MLTYPTVKLLEFGLFPNSKMMDSMTSIGASTCMVSWHTFLWKLKGQVCWIISICILSSILASALCLWRLSPDPYGLYHPWSHAVHLQVGLGLGRCLRRSECRREVRVFLLASVLLPTIVLAMPTPFCLQLLPGSLSFMSLAPNGIQYSLLPPLPLQGQGWLTSPSWLV